MIAGPPVPAHLEHLPRCPDRGIPVPWINRWGAEDLTRVDVRHDPVVDAPAMFFTDDPGGAPDLTRQNFQRQRRAMIHGRCQVCATRTPMGRRWLPLLEQAIDTIDLPALGGPTTVCTEPWLCQACARFATERCPALIRADRGARLRFARVVSPGQIRVVTSYGALDDGREGIMWAKVALARGVEIVDAA